MLNNRRQNAWRGSHRDYATKCVPALMHRLNLDNWNRIATTLAPQNSLPFHANRPKSAYVPAQNSLHMVVFSREHRRLRRIVQLCVCGGKDEAW